MPSNAAVMWRLLSLDRKSLTFTAREAYNHYFQALEMAGFEELDDLDGAITDDVDSDEEAMGEKWYDI